MTPAAAADARLVSWWVVGACVTLSEDGEITQRRFLYSLMVVVVVVVVMWWWWWWWSLWRTVK